MRHSTASTCVMFTAIVLAICGLGGCQSSGSTAGDHLTPKDFQGASGATQTTSTAAANPSTNSTASNTATTADTAGPARGPMKRPEGELTVDAMVGQVNGKPLYASEVFKGIGEEQLERLGESQPRLVFHDEAERLIRSDLHSRVADAVILAEAERGLSENELRGLAGYMVQVRQEIIAKYGAGVPAVAEEHLQQEKGHGIDQELKDRRRQILTNQYLREKLLPKIYITRQDVEHYYQDHYEEFNPKPTVTVRLIIVRDEATADKVDEALKSGEKFGKVAHDFSVFRGDQDGEFGPTPLDGPLVNAKLLTWPALNDKLRTLKVGEHCDRTKIAPGYGWVMLEKLEGGKSQKLQDVFLQIENGLRNRRFQYLSHKYLDDLLEHGNYTPIDQMADALLDVAMTRYARPQ